MRGDCDMCTLFEHCARMAKPIYLVQRALHSQSWPIQHVGVNHRRAHVFVTKEFLHGSNVVAIFQQVGRERMPQRMTTRGLGDSRHEHGILDCVL
jgi:hypothetical protein